MKLSNFADKKKKKGRKTKENIFYNRYWLINDNNERDGLGMDWLITLRILLPVCYFILILAIVRNIAILTITECPPTIVVTKPVFFGATKQLYNSAVGTQRYANFFQKCLHFFLVKYYAFV